MELSDSLCRVCSLPQDALARLSASSGWSPMFEVALIVTALVVMVAYAVAAAALTLGLGD